MARPGVCPPSRVLFLAVVLFRQAGFSCSCSCSFRLAVGVRLCLALESWSHYSKQSAGQQQQQRQRDRPQSSNMTLPPEASQPDTMCSSLPSDAARNGPSPPSLPRSQACPMASSPLPISPGRRRWRSSSLDASNPCLDTFRLYKRCATNSADTEGLSCSAAVVGYMKCALNQC